jgi:uncharacterized Zn finger protein (UPF0148 family)
MSDFDKEAEREKLREKYERDKAEREATQRMSDLLLKGATMTNAHCGTCGDPLFQQDGATFCPSCHGNPDAVQGTDLEARPADESAAQSGDGDDETASTGSESAAAPETDPERAADRTEQTAETEPAGDAGDRPSSPPSRSTSDRDVRTQSTEPSPARAGGNDRSRAQHDAHHDGSDRTPSATASPSLGGQTGDLETARDSLVAALEKFAREAAETDDPRYAKGCLEAAREASETLETLR